MASALLARSLMGCLFSLLVGLSGCAAADPLDDDVESTRSAVVAATGSDIIACAFDEVLCSRRCVDIRHDAQNCGGCNAVCPPGASCRSGRCMVRSTGGPTGSAEAVVPAARCLPWESYCDGACLDTVGDPNNCGGCGSVCDVGTTCIQGHCLSGPLATVPRFAGRSAR